MQGFQVFNIVVVNGGTPRVARVARVDSPCCRAVDQVIFLFVLKQISIFFATALAQNAAPLRLLGGAVLVLRPQVPVAVDVAAALVQRLEKSVVPGVVTVWLDPRPVHVKVAVNTPSAEKLVGLAKLGALLLDVRLDGDGLVACGEPLGRVRERLGEPPRRLWNRVDHRGHERGHHRGRVGAVWLVREARKRERAAQELDAPEVRVGLDHQVVGKRDPPALLQRYCVVEREALFHPRDALDRVQGLAGPLVLHQVLLLGRKSLGKVHELLALPDEIRQGYLREDAPVARLEHVCGGEHIEEERPGHAILDVADGLDARERTRAGLVPPAARHALLRCWIDAALHPLRLLFAEREETLQNGGGFGEEISHACLLAHVGGEECGPFLPARAALRDGCLRIGLFDVADDRVSALRDAALDAVQLNGAAGRELACVPRPLLAGSPRLPFCVRRSPEPVVMLVHFANLVGVPRRPVDRMKGVALLVLRLLSLPPERLLRLILSVVEVRIHRGGVGIAEGVVLFVEVPPGHLDRVEFPVQQALARHGARRPEDPLDVGVSRPQQRRLVGVDAIVAVELVVPSDATPGSVRARLFHHGLELSKVLELREQLLDLIVAHARARHEGVLIVAPVRIWVARHRLTHLRVAERFASARTRTLSPAFARRVPILTHAQRRARFAIHALVNVVRPPIRKLGAPLLAPERAVDVRTVGEPHLAVRHPRGVRYYDCSVGVACPEPQRNDVLDKVERDLILLRELLVVGEFGQLGPAGHEDVQRRLPAYLHGFEPLKLTQDAPHDRHEGVDDARRGVQPALGLEHEGQAVICDPNGRRRRRGRGRSRVRRRGRPKRRPTRLLPVAA